MAVICFPPPLRIPSMARWSPASEPRSRSPRSGWPSRKTPRALPG